VGAQSDLQQRLRLGLNISIKVHRAPRIAAGHESKLARGVVDQDIDEVTAADDIRGLLFGFTVTCAKLLCINTFERSVCIPDEIEQEEDRRVGVWRLHERVRFEGTEEDSQSSVQHNQLHSETPRHGQEKDSPTYSSRSASFPSTRS